MSENVSSRSHWLSPASGPLKGRLSVPGDTSIAHRALCLGSLCDGPLRIANLPRCDAVDRTRQVLERLGVTIAEAGPDEVVVEGRGFDQPLDAPQGPIDVGGSGTSLRLVMGILAGQPFEARMEADASLSARPLDRVAEPLRAMGAEVELADDEHAPLRIKGRRPLRPFEGRIDVPSAEVKTAVLLAGLLAEGTSRLEHTHATRDHTERLLNWLSDGKALRREARSLVLKPTPLSPPGALDLPGDLSAAAALLAAAALVPGSDVSVADVGVNPTRFGFFEVLAAMGGLIAMAPGSIRCGEPRGTLSVGASRLSGVRLLPTRVPAMVDEMPLLAVLASQASGTTRLEGLGGLRYNQSDRLGAAIGGLELMGAQIRTEGEALLIEGPARLSGTRLDTRGDHHLAMAFAVAALVADGESELADAACVARTWPGFFQALAELGT